MHLKNMVITYKSQILKLKIEIIGFFEKFGGKIFFSSQAFFFHIRLCIFKFVKFCQILKTLMVMSRNWKSFKEIAPIFQN